MDSNSTVTSKPKSLKEFLRSWHFWRPFLSIVIGGLGGYLYYYFIGCSSGSCPITSNPYLSIIIGGLLSFLLVGTPGTKIK
jgi:hypothetical protein